MQSSGLQEALNFSSALKLPILLAATSGIEEHLSSRPGMLLQNNNLSLISQSYHEKAVKVGVGNRLVKNKIGRLTRNTTT